MEHFWCTFGALCVHFWSPFIVREQFGCTFGALWVHFWCTLVTLLAHCVQFGRHAGPLHFWNIFGTFWVHFGCTLGALWAPFRHTLGALLNTFGALGVHFWSPFILRAPFGFTFGALWAPSGHFGVHFGCTLGKLWVHFWAQFFHTLVYFFCTVAARRCAQKKHLQLSGCQRRHSIA